MAYKPVNKKYYDMDDPTKAPYVTWDMKDGNSYEIRYFRTNAEVGTTVEQFDEMIQNVIDNYVEELAEGV